jgi:hypothetical protein
MVIEADAGAGEFHMAMAGSHEGTLVMIADGTRMHRDESPMIGYYGLSY